MAPSSSVRKPKLGPDLIDYKSLNQFISYQTKGLFLVVGLRYRVTEVNDAALKDFFFIFREKPLKILISNSDYLKISQKHLGSDTDSRL